MEVGSSFITHTKETPEIKEALEFIGDGNSVVVAQVCKDLGISPELILDKTSSEFEGPYISKETALLRFQHYQARRQARLVIIAEYLIQMKIFEPKGTKRTKLVRSFSTASPRKGKPDLGLYVPLSPRQASVRKINLFKNNVIKRIKFEEKRKKIQEEEAKIRNQAAQKLEEKLRKSAIKVKPDKKQYYETHEKRIKEILMKKHKDLEEHEQKALSINELKKDALKNNSSSIQASQHRDNSASLRPEVDHEIDKRLTNISLKLSHSAERAKRALISKASSGQVSLQIQRVKQQKMQLDSKSEQETVKKVLKIHQSLIESTKRREGILINEQQKRAKSIKVIEERRIEEQLKLEQECFEREKLLEQKHASREKSRIELRGNSVKESQVFLNKSHIRKRRQQKKLELIKDKLHTLRLQQIDKLKDSENSRSKIGLDFCKIRAQVELELKVNKNP